MKGKKKTILIAALGILLIGGILGTSMSVAADDDATASPPGIFEKVAELYEQNTGTALDVGQLKEALTEAHKEFRVTNRNNMLERMVDRELITREKADEFKQWLDEMPDVDMGQFRSKQAPFSQGMNKEFNNFRGLRGFQKFNGDCPAISE